MPRQNRVTPAGDLIATHTRGTLMGNRGCLHDDHGNIRHHHRGRRWIYCRLEFRGRRRVVMTPGRYTELFFLDEATALAAGHRPCAECLRSRFDLFRMHWSDADSGPAAQGVPSAMELDLLLHEERLTRRPEHRRDETSGGFPAGAFVLPEGETAPCLVTDDGLWSWSPQGYTRRSGTCSGRVKVLTPPSIVRTLANGYPFEADRSAFVP